ncbi:MAG: Flp family type IVb pilin [Rhizobiales bacterium]|nr:Flp family type IVb pilin [Hyphomicrobiales bacterium]
MQDLSRNADASCQGGATSGRILRSAGLARFWRDRKGATAIEYGLIAALIAIGMLTGLQDMAQTIVDTYQYILDQYRVANS